MFNTLTSVQTGEAVPLLQPIDNRDGRLKVGLRQLELVVGWYNVTGEESFTVAPSGRPEKTTQVSPGLWGFGELKQRIEHDGVELQVNRSNGMVTLIVLAGRELRLSDGLLDLLGLDDGKGGDWLNPGTYKGDGPVHFSPTRSLHIHLEQQLRTRRPLHSPRFSRRQLCCRVRPPRVPEFRAPDVQASPAWNGR